MGAWEDGFAAGFIAGLKGDMSGADVVVERHGRKVRSQKAKSSSRKARKPSAYNRFMSKELKALRRKHPRTAQATLFKRAAKSWKRKKGKR